MAYTKDQLVTAYTNANLGKGPDAATTLTLDAYATQSQTGGISDAAALSNTLKLVNSTTAVAVETYQFFTGHAPSAAGLAYLVNSTDNANDLNDAYFSNFSAENRFINFSINLATGAGEGAANFATNYTGVSYAQTVASAYDKIIGNAVATAAGVDVAGAVAYLSRQANIDYLTAFVKANTGLTAAADIELAVKAALIGEVLNVATVSGLGGYAKSTAALISDLSDGTLSTDNTAGVNILTAYPTGSVAGATYTLTTSVDTFPGTSADDTFIIDNTVSAVGSVADSLTGGAGADTLKVYGNLDSVPQMTGIETVIADNIATGKTVNTSTATGVTGLTLIRAVGDAIVTVADGTAVTIDSNQAAAAALTVNYGSTDTAASLTLKGVSTTGALTETGTKVATLNVNVASSSTIGTLNGAATLKTVVATGSGNLTITNGLEDSLTKFDASALTGALTVKSTNSGTPDATSGGVDITDINIIGGSGKDSIDVSASAGDNEVSVNAGAGDDTVTIGATVAYSAATSTNAGDSIVGGDGADILAVAGNLAASDMSGAISGFETLRFTASANGTDMSVNKLGFTSFQSTGANTDVTLTGLAANSTFSIDGDGSDLAATIGTDTTADVLNVVLTGTGTGTGSALTATNYETLTIASSTDSSSNTNRVASISATSAKTLTITGATDLTINTGALASGATVNAGGASGALTSTFTTSVKSYVGSTGKDTLTVLAGDLKQGNTFAGGAGTDVINATASASQDLGIVGLTGFETLNLTTSGSNVADLRNVTDLATINVAVSAGTDDLTLNRLGADTTLSFGASIDQVVTTLQTGTSQKIAFTGAATVTSLTLDSGTTTVTITSDDGDATANEGMGAITGLSGTSLASIVVTGSDKLDLGTLATTVTSVDASAAKGALTVTASATGTTIVGSQVADAITGGNGDDVITGGKGGDTLVGGAGHDTYVFAAKGADNGDDAITFTAGAVASSDVLKFSAFLPGGSVDQNGGSGTAVTAYVAGVNDVNIANKVALYSDATEANIDTAAEIAALVQGAGNTFSLTAGGKAILVTGDAGGATDTANVWYIDDSLDGVTGTISATDVVLVGHIATFDIDTLITTNFSFS